MSGNLSFADLKTSVSNGEIDTVIVCMVDMQGRLMGKRFLAQHFVDGAYEETHCCTYLLATDLEMATPEGYASTSWESGYGDYVMKPDLTTLRTVPWLEGTVMVLCDMIDHDTHAPIPHSPRAVLKKQIAKLTDMGFSAVMATELEFFIFKESFEEIAKNGFRNMTPISDYNEDYHIFQTTKEEDVVRHFFLANTHDNLMFFTFESIFMASEASYGYSGLESSKLTGNSMFSPSMIWISLGWVQKSFS